MQKVIVAGNLGRDPETRFSESGMKIVTFTLATNEKQGGETHTTWWRATIFGDRFDRMLPYLKKGSGVIVTGKFRKREWTDDKGEKRDSLEIIVSDLDFSPFGKPSDSSSENYDDSMGGGNQPKRGSEMAYGQGEPATVAHDDDPLPF